MSFSLSPAVLSSPGLPQDPELQVLASRVAQLAAQGHALADVLHDQVFILRRVDEDPPGLFADADPLKAWNEALTTWERAHLRSCLSEYLDVLEAAAHRPAPVRIDVRDFGAVGDGSVDDRPALQRALNALVALGKPGTLVFPAGRYALHTEQEPGSHLVVHGLAQATLEAEPGAELLGRNSATVLRLVGCHDVRVQGLTFAYDPALATEGRVLTVDDSGRAVSWRADPGALEPDALRHGQAHLGACLFDGHGSMRRGQHGMRAVAWQKEERAGEAPIWQIRLEGGDVSTLAPGDRLALFRRFRWAQAVVLSECAWVDLANISIHGAPEFALLIESCEGISVRGAQVGPRPGLVSGLNADGVHVRSNRYGPFFHGCEVRGVQDDCFNLQSRMVSVVDIVDERTLVLDLPWDATERLGYWQPRRADFVTGDMLAFLAPVTGGWAGWGQIVATAEHEWREHRRLRVTLDRPVPGLVSRESLGKTRPVASSSEYLNVGTETLIEHFAVNASTKADGFVIRGCVLGNNSVTGGKIKAGNGLIVDNRSANHGWCAWSFATELLWQEGYAVRRVLVQGNHHTNWFGVFMGSQHPGNTTHLGPPLHYRVELVDNVFVGHDRHQYALDLNGVVGCTVEGNVFDPDRPVVLGPTARHVRVAGNRVSSLSGGT